jgi:hypothetical protein
VKREEILLGAGIVVAGIVLYLLWGKLMNINAGTPYAGGGPVGTLGNLTNQALGGAPQAIGESGPVQGLLDKIFGAPKSSGDSTFYTVTFPDGSRHSVPASTVDAQGDFTYNGQFFSLAIDPTSGYRVAVAW